MNDDARERRKKEGVRKRERLGRKPRMMDSERHEREKERKRKRERERNRRRERR